MKRCVRARIIVVKSDPSSAVGFPVFLEDNWQKNGWWITQNWLICVVLVVRLRNVQFFRKNNRSFAWKCFVREELLLDLAHLEIPIQSTAVYFRAHTLKSTIHHLSRCHRRSFHFFPPICTRLLSDWQIVQIFLTGKCSCNIECMHRASWQHFLISGKHRHTRF